MKAKSESIAAKIEAMQAELAAAKQAESDAADRELLKLVHRAGCRDEAIRFVRRLIDQQKREKGADRDGE